MAYIYSETIFILFANKLYFAMNHTYCVLPFFLTPVDDYYTFITLLANIIQNMTLLPNWVKQLSTTNLKVF